MEPSEIINYVWKEKPELLRAFLQMRPRFEELAEEVEYVIKKTLRGSGIEYSAIASRAKTLNSFCQKAFRKKYTEPTKDMTDIAGVRIVFLYLKDRPKLEKLIEKEFHVIEKVDKAAADEPDRFGYGALHYLVTLGKKASGARYDDLKNLVCEIQVRTILQDAWATVAHHLSYKQESDIPNELLHDLNALSGTFSVADKQFGQLRDERLKYKNKVSRQISEHKSVALESTINVDNLMEFLRWRLPDRPPIGEHLISWLWSILQKYGYSTIAELDKLLSQAYDAVKAFESKYPPTDEETGEKARFSQMGVIIVALQFINDDVLDWTRSPESSKDRVREFRHMVKEK